MELYKHNELAYDRIIKGFETSNKVCVVQPTGTGKSFLSAKLMFDNPSKKILFLTSSNYIIEQFKRSFTFDNYIGLAYSSLLSNSVFENIIKNEFDYIIVDEFHRIGAEDWGEQVYKILDKNNKSNLLGLSATHIRNEHNEDGSVRNMAIELFDNNIVHHITLREAFDIGILPSPTYVTALYTLEQDYDNVLNGINNSNVKNKDVLKEKLLERKIAWDKSKGVSSILKKHIKTERNFVVFCRNIEHLEKSTKELKKWFKIAFPNKKSNVFKVYSSLNESDDNLLNFIENSKNKEDDFNLLLSVQKLNEGIHVPTNQGVIFLRPTESHIIYYQQLGRCLESKGTKPLVFDLVNNYKRKDFHSKFIEESKVSSNNESLIKEYKNNKYSFNLIDEVTQYQDIFDDIKYSYNDWNVHFEKVKEDLELVNNYKLLNEKNKKFIDTHRFLLKQGKLSEHKIKKLDALNSLFGFDWKEGFLLDKWTKDFSNFKTNLIYLGDYYKLTKDDKKWFSNQKYLYKKFIGSDLFEKRFKDLSTLDTYLGCSWIEFSLKPFGRKINSNNWDSNFEEFKKKLIMAKSYDNLISKDKKWLTYQRNNFLKSNWESNKKSNWISRVEKLDNINHILGFDWKEPKKKWTKSN